MIQPQLDFTEPFDARGHEHFCRPMCEAWIAHFGRANLHVSTLGNLEWFAERPPNCRQCALDALGDHDKAVLAELTA